MDNLFENSIVKQFEFDEKVVSVFDDMIDRSVPFYKETMQLTTDFALYYLKPYDRVYDLGCSTGSTLLSLSQKSTIPLDLRGIDRSDAMLHQAQHKANAYGIDITWMCDDMLATSLENSKIIMANYTLQFIRPLNREALVQKIYDALDPEGLFIFSEKIIVDDKMLNKQCIDIYHQFKLDQGYSQLEISHKREALENVLVPYTEQENKTMLYDTGFKVCETIFKWVNFATFVAKK